ncbi:MAG TPA: DNA-binding protein [Acetobacteraceae bacterium]|jgi:predicted transcriptional regulator
MSTLIIGNQPVEQRRAEIARAWKTGKPEAAARLDFESLEGAWQLLNSRRWALLRAMAGQGPLAIREIARRVERDVRAVHSDVRKLYLSGVIDKTPEGKMILQYDVIRLDFTLDTHMAA